MQLEHVPKLAECSADQKDKEDNQTLIVDLRFREQEDIQPSNYEQNPSVPPLQQPQQQIQPLSTLLQQESHERKQQVSPEGLQRIFETFRAAEGPLLREYE
jgi:hypothetical protein